MRAALARWLPAGSFARNVGILTGGTAFAQGLAVLALPLLTRLYSPEDFSLLAVYVAIIGIATVVSCLRYNIAIPLPEDDADGMALLSVALIAATVISALLALPALLAPAQTAALLGQPGLAPYLWMVPLGVFLASTYNALQYWASRKKRFGLVTRTRMTRAVGGIGTQVGIGATAPSPFGLLFGHMLYGGLGVIGLARDLWRRDHPALRQLSGAKIFGQSAAYRRFPVWSVPEALFNTAGVQVPVILIAAAAAGPEAGFLMLAMRVVSMPIGLIGTSVAQVYFAHAPEAHRNKQLGQFTKKTMWALFKVGIAPLAVLAAISPMVFPIIFGPEWERAGWLVFMMAPLSLIQFVTSPVSMVLHVVNGQKTAMILQAFGLMLRVSAVVVAARYFPRMLTEVYISSGIIFYIIYFLVINVILRFDNEKTR